MERLKVFDILHHDYLSLINLTLACDAQAIQLFEQLEEKEIRIKFLAVQKKDKDGGRLSFCIERSSLKSVQKILTRLDLEKKSSIYNDAGMIAVYGPHFGEKAGIIDMMHNVLTKDGISVFGISTTISTSYFVVPGPQVFQAVETLKKIFEIPQGR